MVNCENPDCDSISSSWDSVVEFSKNNSIGKIQISPDLQTKLNNLIGSKANSLSQTPKPLTIPSPPPPPPFSLNSITNQKPKLRKKSIDIDDDNLTSISNTSSHKRKTTLIIKKHKNNNPLPRLSHICVDTPSNEIKENVNKSPKYNLNMTIDKRSVHYLSVCSSFIVGYFFCFYFGKSC